MYFGNIDSLLDCHLFIFDLDGTVYEETSHFQFYSVELSRQVDKEKAAAYLDEVESALQGKHAVLTFGVSYDPVHDVIVRDGDAHDWSGRKVSVTPTQNLVHVDDPWSVCGVVAAHHGVRSNALQEAFLATRKHMESSEFTMRGMAGLREAIDTLSQMGRRFVLATNSPEPDSRIILEKLGLTGAFEDLVFNAIKQDRAVEHFTRWHELYQIPYESMVSIGDHYRNEIHPAANLGMRTIYIDRYIRKEAQDVTVQVEHPGEVAGVLQEVIERLRSRTH